MDKVKLTAGRFFSSSFVELKGDMLRWSEPEGISGNAGKARLADVDLILLADDGTASFQFGAKIVSVPVKKGVDAQESALRIIVRSVKAAAES
jgi:hypothetical protein